MKKWSWFTAILVIGLIGLMPQASVYAEDAVPAAAQLWTASFDKDITWQRVTGAGYLLVCTGDGLYGINPETGETAWKIEDIRKVPEDLLEIVDGTQFAVISKKTGPLGANTETLLVDVIDGKILWSSKEVGVANTMGQFLYLPNLSLIIYGQAEKTLKPVTVMADLTTGTPIWTSNTLHKKAPEMFTMRVNAKAGRMGIVGNQPPVALPDGNFIEFWSKVGPRKINAQTGEVMWETKLKFKEVPALRSGYASIMLSEDGQTAYIPHDNTIDAINTADGTVLWAKPPKLISKVVQMQLTPQGLILRGAAGEKSKPFITVVNPQTGESMWKKPFRDLRGASSFAVKDDKIAIYADGSVFLINIADGAFTEAIQKIKFDGGEDPSSLDLREGGGYFLVSDQNLAAYDEDGNVVYHAYHKAPGSSLLSKVASTAAIAAMNAMSAAEAHSKAQSTGMDQKYTMITSNPVMSRRFKATAETGKSVTMLTRVDTGEDKGAGLVKVDKADGKDLKGVVLDTKKPEYEMDEIGSRLFFMKNDKTIVCYSF